MKPLHPGSIKPPHWSFDRRADQALKNAIRYDRNPVFLIESASRRICMASDTALARISSHPEGQVLEQLLHQPLRYHRISPCYLQGEWYLKTESVIPKRNGDYTRITLQRPENQPDSTSLHDYRKMASTLLHQLRSPLTGIHGYLELIETGLAKDNLRRMHDVKARLEKLFSILDEMEDLYHLPLADGQHSANENDLTPIVESILWQYAAPVRERFVIQEGEPSVDPCHETSRFRPVLEYLLENALAYSPDTSRVTVDRPAPCTLRITNHGEVIPEPVAGKIFYPFVTTQANRLGIGLTKACLLARREGGGVFLTSNSAEEGISFTLCLPPGPVGDAIR